MSNKHGHSGTDHSGQYSAHFQAAAQYQAAAHHHLQAAHHDEHGQHEKAMKHAEAARRHGAMGHQFAHTPVAGEPDASTDSTTDK